MRGRFSEPRLSESNFVGSTPVANTQPGAVMPPANVRLSRV
jgi:hypothetical protein